MSDDFEKFRELLKDQNYPSVYLYKMIFKKDFEELVALKNCFEETAEFSTKESRNGKYISLSVKQMMLSTDDIIEKYKQIHQFEGVIVL